jgi:tripartite-type tricarboxylate transporter receptor subunit TctC
MKKAILFLAASILAVGAHAQEFPSKPIRMIVPFPPGGPADVIARPLAEGMQSVLGQPVIVDFRPGAGAILGVRSLLSSPADGHTLLVGSNVLVLSKWLYKKLPYDPQRDLRGVIGLASSPYLVLVPSSFPGSTINDLVRAAKAQPGKLNFASSGPGTLSHVTAERFKRMASVDLTHVPYKGAGPALIAVITGEVAVFFDNVFSSQAHVRSGKLKALGVTSLARVEQFPNLATVDEQGVKGDESAAWFGIVVQKSVPDPVVARLNDAINRALQTPLVRERYASLGVTQTGGTVQAFQKLIDDDVDTVGKVIAAMGLSLD